MAKFDKQCSRRFLIIFVLTTTLTFRFKAEATDIHRGTYEEGKKQYELIQHQAGLPNYGQCWKNAMVFIQSGCTKLTDDLQGRLALAYLNCFLELQGRPRHECNEDQTLEECTRVMDASDRGSFTTFFTHTQNICYFLRAQVWNEATENTISLLAESSSNVAAQLRHSSELQTEMIKQQNDTLQNQKYLMENAANLTNVLSNSSEEVNRLAVIFKETTQEQRLLITDVFEQLTSLKQTVLGEFSGFYAILYYFFSVLVCYLLTSTTRTSHARFWLFGIVTTSIFCEYLISAWVPCLLAWTPMNVSGHDDFVFWMRSSSRKLFALVCLLVLGLCAYHYRDINTANNQLLVEIKKQNSDLRRLLCGSQLALPDKRLNGYAAGSTPGDQREVSVRGSDDSQSDTTSVDSESDRTYILEEKDPSVSESDSYATAETLRGTSMVSHTVSGRSDSLLQELRDLRCATPLKEISGQMERWISTGEYRPQPNTSVSGDISFGGSPYSLRPRRGRSSGPASPAAQVESPQSFAKTVRQLERIAEKNSRMVCATVHGSRKK